MACRIRQAPGYRMQWKLGHAYARQQKLRRSYWNHVSVFLCLALPFPLILLASCQQICTAANLHHITDSFIILFSDGQTACRALKLLCQGHTHGHLPGPSYSEAQLPIFNPPAGRMNGPSGIVHASHNLLCFKLPELPICWAAFHLSQEAEACLSSERLSLCTVFEPEVCCSNGSCVRQSLQSRG